MHYDLTTLPGGLRVITEQMPSLRSVAVGCWVDTGTRDETEPEAGASHFLEHLLFKGSERLSAREIAETFDAMGAESNAFTSKDYTCFWARLLDQDLPRGLEVLAEMLQQPAFRIREIDAERQVVIEEINMNEDDPSDVAFEQFVQAVFEGHPLERPVLGTRESIRAMTRDDIAGYWGRRYAPGSTVVAMAGSIDHDQVVKMVDSLFGEWTGEEIDHESAPVHDGPSVRVVNRETEQAHLVLGGLGINRTDPRRWAFQVLHQVLGGGMSSRLFDEIREKRGLAYAVYSFRMAHADAGAWGVYVGTTPAQAETALELIEEEIEKVMAEGITEAELERAKGAMRGGLALALEEANSRMVRLGRDELTGAPHYSVGERLSLLDAVTLDDVRNVASQVMGGHRALGAVGPFSEGDLDRFVH
ncbi:MAG: pitrilysin family protein [Acidimicrobiia bacterium]